MKEKLVQKIEFELHDEQSRLDAKATFDGNLVFGSKKFHEETGRSANKKGPADGAMHSEQKNVVEDVLAERFQRKTEFWEPVSECPVCKSSEREFYLTRFALDIYSCNNCSHHYMDPRIKFDKLSQLYAHDETAARVYTSDVQRSLDERKSLYGLDLIQKLDPPGNDKILDFGCGSGTFLKVAHKIGWRSCVGIDANSEYAGSYAEEDGLQFICSTFETIDTSALGGDYDVITMWNVLEHLYDLDEILENLRSMLKPEGLLFVMVPNVRSLATRLIREKSATFNWKHVSHFSPKSLSVLMGRNGFELSFLETAISEIENVKSYLSGAWPYSGFGDPEGLFDHITPQYIHQNLLGSRIIGVFRRL